MTLAAIDISSEATDYWQQGHINLWESNPLAAFESWLSSRRFGSSSLKLREASLDTYTAMFNGWVSHVNASGLNLLNANSTSAEEFFNKKALDPSSRRRYLQLLMKVYGHLVAMGWRGKNPIDDLIRKERELDVALPVGLSEPQVELLCSYLNDLRGWKGSRDRAMAALLMGAGLRSNEACRLDLSALHCNTQNWVVRVTPEGVHKEHYSTVLTDGPWRDWLTEWLTERTAIAMPGLILCPATSKGGSYSTSGLFRRIDKWLTAVDLITDQRGANTLRNTFARTAIASGRYSLEQVQGFLGHETLRPTAKHIPIAAVPFEPAYWPDL